MLVRTGRIARVAVSVAAVLAVGGVVAWAVGESYRPREASELAATLQRLVLERTILSDEYQLEREERPRAQFHEHSVRIAAALARYAASRPSAEERTAVAELEASLRESDAIFQVIEDGAERVARRGMSRGLMEVRASRDLLLIAYELYDGASRLADAAAERERVRQRSILAIIAVVVLLAIAGTFVVAAVTTALLARRLSRLAEGANRVAAGDFAHRIGMEGDDEVARVAGAFDAMAARVAAGVRQLESSNQELEAFSYSVSHDLSAPLRHMTGFADLLVRRAGDGLDEKSRHYLAIIREAALRMGRLIDDLLALSRLGRAALVPEELALRPLVDAIVAELAPQQPRAPEVVWEIGALPVVVADPGLLRLVLANLVGNAVKFTRTRPVARIELGARADEDEVRVFVRDNGVGFDPRLADRLFGMFQRLHPAEEFEGNGIGLANVRRIVHRHGGRVGAEGRVDGGATFWFTLPRRGRTG